MFTKAPVWLRVLSLFAFLFFSLPSLHGRQSPRMGGVRFTADNQAERDAGVWIDGRYAGYVKELKGDRKIMLPAGEHQISIRQAGYKELMKTVTIGPDQIETVAVVLEENSKVTYPGSTAAEYRLDISPKRAAVFVDGSYMGHGGDFSGRFHSMLISPGKHHLKISLDGYRSYETDVDAVASSKSRMTIVLEQGSDAPPAQ
jgi:PEGA domain